MRSKVMSEKLMIEFQFAKCYTDNRFRLAPNDRSLLGILHACTEKQQKGASRKLTSMTQY